MKPKMQIVSTFQVDGKLGNYLVTLERLKNTNMGTPRFKATIVDLNSYCFATCQYTFHGHYLGDDGEAEWIVNHYENN